MMDLSKHIVSTAESIRDTIKKMDESKTNFIVAVESRQKVKGIVTEGDIRRAILNGLDLQDSVGTIVNRDYKSLAEGYSNAQALRLFKSKKTTHLPVLNNGRMTGIVQREEFVKDEAGDSAKKAANFSVVIMAGGKGTRLDPFTRILPKPLIPIGNEPIIKIIMDKFGKFGINNFYVSLNDKAKMVKAYFQDHDYGYKIHYIEENQPLGTAGALKFLETKVKESFFVSNCDVLINTDYMAFYDFHKKGNHALSLVASMHQFTVPYGVCEIDNGGVLKNMREKPGYDLLVNTGLYLVKPEILKYVPANKHFDMTDLIKAVKAKGLKVGVYPISEKSWMDLGQWVGYKNVLNELNLD